MVKKTQSQQRPEICYPAYTWLFASVAGSLLKPAGSVRVSRKWEIYQRLRLRYVRNGSNSRFPRRMRFFQCQPGHLHSAVHFHFFQLKAAFPNIELHVFPLIRRRNQREHLPIRMRRLNKAHGGRADSPPPKFGNDAQASDFICPAGQISAGNAACGPAVAGNQIFGIALDGSRHFLRRFSIPRTFAVF